MVNMDVGEMKTTWWTSWIYEVFTFCAQW